MQAYSKLEDLILLQAQPLLFLFLLPEPWRNYYVCQNYSQGGFYYHPNTKLEWICKNGGRKQKNLSSFPFLIFWSAHSTLRTCDDLIKSNLNELSRKWERDNSLGERMFLRSIKFHTYRQRFSGYETKLVRYENFTAEIKLHLLWHHFYSIWYQIILI